MVGRMYIQGGHAHAFRAAAHAGEVVLRPEELQTAVRAAIALGTFKDSLAVMENHGRRIHREIAVGDDTGIFPALALFIVHEEHMVGKDPTETKGRFIRRLLFEIL